MRRALLVAIAALALVSCGSDRPKASGGISGTVHAGPTCPVETAESPCPPAIWTGIVRATAADGQTFETQTDGSGHYALHLPPGDYSVAAVTSGGPPTGVPADVVVADTVINLDLEVDTGIR